MSRLLDIVLSLDAEDRRALSAISIERRREDGRWQARCSIARNKFCAEQATPSVGLMVWERVPDQIYLIELDELERDRSVRVQAVQLQESGLVGTLDLARYDSAERTTSYLIKTHAGSQQERTAWLMRLKERPENTLYQEQSGPLS